VGTGISPPDSFSYRSNFRFRYSFRSRSSSSCSSTTSGDIFYCSGSRQLNHSSSSFFRTLHAVSFALLPLCSSHFIARTRYRKKRFHNDTHWKVSDLFQLLVRAGMKSWYLSFQGLDDLCVTLRSSVTVPRSGTMTLESSAMELKSSCTACGMLCGGKSGHFCCIVSSESQYWRTDISAAHWITRRLNTTLFRHSKHADRAGVTHE